MSTGMRKWMEKGCPEIEHTPAQEMIDREELRQLRDELAQYKNERDALQAKIAEMEQQEPAYWGPKHAIEGGSTTVIVGKFPVNPTDAPLYALPGAKGEKK